MLWSLGQEIARLIMEQEKKEYKKIREREKEKERERDRERAAMEKIAMERRRHEGDYRVIFHKWRLFHVCFGVKCLCHL